MIDLAIVVTTFALILPAELPDKTFIATLVLATRFPRLWVWLGVASAFAIQVLIAVTAGGLLALLPQRLVLGITFVLFAAGAVIMIKGGLASRAEEQAEEADEEAEIASRADEQAPDVRAPGVRRRASSSCSRRSGATSARSSRPGLAARTGEPVSVFIGSWSALLVVSGIAVLVGAWLRTRVPIWRIRLVSGGILTALAIWTLVEFVRA